MEIITHVLRLFLLSMCMLSLQAQPSGYSLVWSDEFNGDSLDMAKWNYRSLGPRRDGINVKEATVLDGKGNLLITTTKVDTAYHVGTISTDGRFSTKYGYFECRAMLQKKLGHWSAFWIQSPTVTTVGDPAINGTEIDVFEYLRKEGDVIRHNLHWDGYSTYHKSFGKIVPFTGIGVGYHTFAVEWTPEEYVFFVDGVETFRTDTAVSQRPQYIILSEEVGTWAGEIDSVKNLPDTTFFDYVRVYQKNTTPVVASHENQPVKVFPTITSHTIQIEGYSQSRAILMDILGNTKMVSISNGRIDISALKSGIYFLIIDKQKPIRFVKQ